MFLKRKIGLLSVLIITLSLSPVAWGRTSHDVLIKIAEIGRYRVENESTMIDGSDLVQAVDVVILSNSDRKWRFMAVPDGNCAGMEWSADYRVWRGFESGTGETMVLTGARSNWQRYRFYVKIKARSNETVSLGYQLLFNE